MNPRNAFTFTRFPVVFRTFPLFSSVSRIAVISRVCGLSKSANPFISTFYFPENCTIFAQFSIIHLHSDAKLSPAFSFINFKNSFSKRSSLINSFFNTSTVLSIASTMLFPPCEASTNRTSVLFNYHLLS